MEYTKTHIAFLKKHGAMPRKELADLFNANFGTNQSDKAIKTRCQLLGLKCASNGRFKKGDTPFNKDTKGFMGANKTSFKPGLVPHNTQEIGKIVKRKDNKGRMYARIKVAEPNVWQMLHVYIWEQRYGKIPKGFCVIFKDKNTENMSLENLMLVSRNELVRLNQKYSAIDKSLKEVALQVIKIQNEVIKKERL